MSQSYRQLAQVMANKFFLEYKNMPKSTIKNDLKRWRKIDGGIFELPLEEQASYADYVTNKMCDQDDENIIIGFAINNGTSLKSMQEWNGACSVGNAARLIQKLQEIGQDTLASNISASLDTYRTRMINLALNNTK